MLGSRRGWRTQTKLVSDRRVPENMGSWSCGIEASEIAGMARVPSQPNAVSAFPAPPPNADQTPIWSVFLAFWPHLSVTPKSSG